MTAIRNLSIQTKIILIIVVISSINSFLAAIFQYQIEKQQYNKYTIEKLKILAFITGESNVATIIFNDKKVGTEYLSTLKADQYIHRATIFLPDSTEFLSYTKNDSIGKISSPEIPLHKDTCIILDEYIVINKTVFFQDEFVGSIRMEYGLGEYTEKQRQFIVIAFFVFFVSLMIASILAYFLQKVITNPILRLEQVMNRISTEKDYTIRSLVDGGDEIGKLSNGFNSMIARIEGQNNELKKAKALSDQALVAKERFLANITHELRTPLNSIIGLSTLIEETKLNAEQTEYLKNIKLSSDHLLVIINDLLEFTKIGSGKVKLEKMEFSIRKTIERIERSMEFELKNRNLQFLTNIDKDVPQTVVGDEYRLNQILINLIGNAVKFTPAGHIKASASIYSEDDTSFVIEFKIEDTGIGISSDKLQVIFDSFTQESTSTNRKYGGTGLGLTITRQLVELQGGTINVQSVKDKGSIFTFYIPYLKNFMPEQQKVKPVKTNHRLLRIMLVDDNTLNLMFTKSMLEKNNFAVKTFEKGKEALEYLNSDQVDLILLDLHMPELDGYEICIRIRNSENPNIRNIPVVALTAAATEGEITKCFESGMNDYIVKPFKKDELITKLLSLSPELK